MAHRILYGFWHGDYDLGGPGDLVHGEEGNVLWISEEAAKKAREEYLGDWEDAGTNPEEYQVVMVTIERIL
jgi:hypothetical protein